MHYGLSVSAVPISASLRRSLCIAATQFPPPQAVDMPAAAALPCLNAPAPDCVPVLPLLWPPVFPVVLPVYTRTSAVILLTAVPYPLHETAWNPQP